jgi:copper chaperone CopZ
MEQKVLVKGMSCNHCKMAVEMNLKKIAGMETVLADLGSGEVLLKGASIDLDKVKQVVEDIGYAYDGPVN